MSHYISPVAASIEISLDHQNQCMITSRKASQETGRLLNAKEAIERLYEGHTITSVVGTHGATWKRYTPHVDGSVYIVDGHTKQPWSH